MVTPFSPRRASFALAALVAAGCDATVPLPSFDETPTVVLLLTPILGTHPADSGLFALLVTTGTPLESPYLRADRFEMRRLSDGARFAWRATDAPSEPIGFFPEVGAANYFLPRQGGPDGLGADSLTHGETYQLAVDAGPHRVAGRTRIPDRVEFVQGPTDGDTIVRWRRTPGAGAYRVVAQLDYIDARFIADTAVVFRLPPLPPGEKHPRGLVRVFAVDTNYAAFDRDFRASAAGVTAAWGLFGSYTWSDGFLPSAAAAPARR